MDLNDYIERIKQARERLISNRQSESLQIAQDILALVQYRVQSTGTNYLSASFAPYSQQRTQQRQQRGRQTRYVDFTDTGELWRSIAPRISANSESATEVTIDARDTRNKEKLDKALIQPRQNPRGNILMLSSDDIDDLTAAHGARIAKYLSI
jgi:hypothetical protein